MRASSPQPLAAFLLFILAATALPASAQPVLRATRVAEFEIDGMVRDLAMDEFGLIWVGTQSGLYRVDGHGVRRWTQSEEGIGHNDVLALHTDEEGTIWAGTSGGGLARIDPAAGEVRRVAGTDSMFVTRLASGGGSLFLGTWEDGVWRLTGDSLAQLLPGTTGQRVQGLEVVGHRVLAVLNATHAAAVDLSSGRVDTLTIDFEARGYNHLRLERNRLRVGSYGPGAILDLNPETGETTTVAPDLATVYDAVTDAAGRLWIATNDGLHVHTAGTTTTPARPRERNVVLPPGRVRTLLLDADQFLWIGTDRGLYRASTRQLDLGPERFGPEDDAPPVLAVHEDENGRLWLGTQDDGLIERLPDGTYREGDEGVATVSAIAEGPPGVLWLGSLGQGLFRLDTETGAVAPFRYRCPEEDCNPSNQILGILAESDALWLATNGGGLLRFDRGESTFARFLPESANERFLTGVVRRADGLWLGSAGGVLRFTNGAFAAEETTRSDHILDLFQDSRGTVWAASYGGGLLRHDGAWTRFSEDDGLPENLVASVAEDAAGRIWVSTLSQQPAVFDPETSRFIPIPSQAGIATGSSPGGLAAGASGRLYLAGTGYMSVFEGDSLPAPPLPGVLLQDGPGVTYAPTAVIPIGRSAGYPLRVLVPSYDPELRMRCDYRIDGGDWVDCGGATTTLGSVRAWPGESTLEVRATGIGLPETRATFTVDVLADWWQTPWMLLAWAGLLVGAAWTGLGTVDRVRRERARKLEARLQRGRQAERDQLASWLHDHSVNDLIGVRHLLEGTDGAQEAAARLAEIRQQLRNVCGELQMPSLDRGLGEALLRHLDAFGAANPELRVAHRIARENDWLEPEGRHNLFIAYRTVMANVVRHASAESVEVDWEVTGDEARLRVADNGRGFDREEAVRRADEAGRYGLLLAETHLRTVGGRMDVHTAPGAGTTIVLTLRRDQEARL